MSEFVVTPERLALATRVLAEKSPALPGHVKLAILQELGWDDQVDLQQREALLTPIQIVALAAIFAAVVDAGMRVDETAPGRQTPEQAALDALPF